MRFGSDAAGSAWGSKLLKDPDVAETKLTGVLDVVWAVALPAVTACPWLSPAGTDPPQLQTRAATAAKQTMNRCMVIIRAWTAGCSCYSPVSLGTTTVATQRAPRMTPASLRRRVILPSWSPPTAV